MAGFRASKLAAFADSNDLSRLPDPGKCLPNVGAFAQAHLSDARRLAALLGHGVTPTEILATAGNETHYGDLTRGFAKFGNFFGLHGHGPAGTYYTTRGQVPTQRFPVTDGFLSSGEVFVRKQAPNLKGDTGRRPLDFYTALNNNGYATGNAAYPAFMTRGSRDRGPYTLMRACTGRP